MINIIKTLPIVGWVGIALIVAMIVFGVILTVYYRRRQRELESFVRFTTFYEDGIPRREIVEIPDCTEDLIL